MWNRFAGEAMRNPAVGVLRMVQIQFVISICND